MGPQQRAALEDAAAQRAEDDRNRTGDPDAPGRGPGVGSQPILPVDMRYTNTHTQAMTTRRAAYRVPVDYDGPDTRQISYQYVWANDPDDAAREATANVDEEHPGSDPFADPDQITEYAWRDEAGTLRCARYNKRRQGMCDAVLGPRGECPQQGEHGWSDGS